MQASRILGSTAPPATVLVRVMVGWVFMSEGIQKFLFSVALGVGRFAKIGIPAPQFFGPFVGVVETVCGALLIVGLVTRLASIPLLIDMVCHVGMQVESGRATFRIHGIGRRWPNSLAILGMCRAI